MNTKHNIAVLWAVLAAALYAISSPVSKILLSEIPPTLMAGLLYLGAGIGMAVIGLLRYKMGNLKKEMRLTKKEIPYTVAMVVLDIMAPILLMAGLTMTTPANVSLLNNFEIVATSLIALFIFKEVIHRKLWFAIILITMASVILTVEDATSFSFSFGSIFVLLATACWGFENNCTRMLSVKDPLQVVIIKGFGSGLGSLVISFLIKETSANAVYIFAALLLGFVAYGLSIYFYVYAQRELGAAKTSAYYAIAPFIGVGLSFIIFHEIPSLSFMIALFIMIVGTYYASVDNNISENIDCEKE
jgi:drug/metabolite transporter (DMT)-like permease